METLRYEMVINVLGEDGSRNEKWRVERNLTGTQFDHLKGMIDRADQVVPALAETTSGEHVSLDAAATRLSKRK